MNAFTMKIHSRSAIYHPAGRRVQPLPRRLASNARESVEDELNPMNRVEDGPLRARTTGGGPRPAGRARRGRAAKPITVRIK